MGKGSEANLLVPQGVRKILHRIKWDIAYTVKYTSRVSKKSFRKFVLNSVFTFEVKKFCLLLKSPCSL
jgi:hypothetical protein